jgi:glycosyltransferase involved in cell wall biosynthesis
VDNAIKSAFAQTYGHIEVLVQDNCSTDGTWSLLENIRNDQPTLKLKKNKVHVGMSANWNAVIQRAAGDFVLLLSADDFLEPGFVEACLQVFATEDVDIVTTNHYFLTVKGKFERKALLKEGSYDHFASLILLKNPFSINFSLMTRESIANNRIGQGLYAFGLYTCDYEFWLRISKGSTRVHYISRCLGTYRVHDANLSRQKRRMARHTLLAVLRHREFLARSCVFVYRLTLARLFLRNIRFRLAYKVVDARSFYLILKAIFA